MDSGTATQAPGPEWPFSALATRGPSLTILRADLTDLCVDVPEVVVVAGDGVEGDPNRASSNSTSPSGSSRSQSEVGPPSSPRASESAEATIARLRRENAELQRRCEQAETYATRCTRLLAAHEERCKLLTSMNVKLEQIVREGKTAAAAATAAAVGGAPPPASQQLATSPPSAATSPPPTFATPAASSQRAAHSAPPPSPLQPQPQAPPPARRAS